MEYFQMSQDKTIPNAVEPVGVLKVIEKDMIKQQNFSKSDEIPVQFEIKDNDSTEYIDFIEFPVPLVSDRMKNILCKYDDRTFFKPIFLADIKRSRQDIYWLMVPGKIDCLSQKSEMDLNGAMKRIVIDYEKVRYNKIFTIKGIVENIIIVRLDVAESILRRGFTGIRLTRLEMDI